MIICFDITINHPPRYSATIPVQQIISPPTRHHIVRSYRKRSVTEHARKVVANGPYRYDYGDGVTMVAEVREVDQGEARRMRKTWCTNHYDWVADSIWIQLGIAPSVDLTKMNEVFS